MELLIYGVLIVVVGVLFAYKMGLARTKQDEQPDGEVAAAGSVVAMSLAKWIGGTGGWVLFLGWAIFQGQSVRLLGNASLWALYVVLGLGAFFLVTQWLDRRWKINSSAWAKKMAGGVEGQQGNPVAFAIYRVGLLVAVALIVAAAILGSGGGLFFGAR